MRLDSIALKNISRRWVKAVFVVLGVVIGLGTVVALYSITGAMNLTLGDTFDEIGANIMVLPRGNDAISYGGVTVPARGRLPQPLTNEDVMAINTIPNRDNVAYVAPKVLGRVQATLGAVSVVGVDFPVELAMKSWWRYTGARPSGVGDLLVGSKVASLYGLQPGQDFTLAGRSFTVAAVLEEQGGEEDELVFMPLLSAQDLLNKKGQLSLIEVAAYCTTCPIEQIMAQISTKLPHARVTALAEAVQAREQVIGRFNGFAAVVSGVVLAVGLLVVLLTMLSSVSERTREIGVLRALGYRAGHVFEVILTEAAVLGLVGGALGYLLGVAVARGLGSAIAQMAIEVPWSPLVAGVFVLVAAGVTVLVSIYPAIKAARLDPAEALRYI